MAMSKEAIEKTRQTLLAAKERWEKMPPEEKKRLQEEYEKNPEKQILIPD